MSFPKLPMSADGAGPAGGATSHLKHSVNNECIAGMDMIYELFQQQAKRLELQLYQQLRDQAEIESTHNQLSAASQQLQRLQMQNAELRRLVDANEMSIRAMYEHARSVQQAQNGLLTVCDNLAKDKEILRQALREECPDWAEKAHEAPPPDLPTRSAELPPLEDLLPPPEASGEAAEGGHSNHQHMETALALLSTVATRKADASTAAAETGSSADAGYADQQASNHGSNGSDTGSNHGSSNPGTEDTAVLSRDGNGNERSSMSKGSPEEGDSNDGVGSCHGSDSNGDSPVDPTVDSGSRDGSGDSKRSGDSNDGHSNGDSNSDGGRDGSGGSADGLPVGDGSSGTSASRSGSNSSSPPHEIDVEPPSELPKEAIPSGSKRKR